MSVVKLYPANAAENPDNVLELAKGKLENVAIIGVEKVTGDVVMFCDTKLTNIELVGLLGIGNQLVHSAIPLPVSTNPINV